MPPSLVPIKPLDVVVALAIHDLGGAPWTYATLAMRLGVSDSQVHGAVRRAIGARLIDGANRRVRARNLLEFLEHGIRYAFPVQPGPLTRGVPTSASAPPLASVLKSDGAGELVWPDLDGALMGQSVEPLHPEVPKLARRDGGMHELLALVDALRLGRVREREMAAAELRRRLEPAGA